MPEPTQERIMALDKFLMGVWQDAHRNWEDIDTYYNLNYKLWPLGMDRASYHSPRARSIIDSAVDQQLSGTPRVKRPQSGRAEVHAVRADRIEPYLQAVLEESAILELSPTWKTLAKNLLLYGYAILEFGLAMGERPEEPDPEDYDDEDEFKRAEIIFENGKKQWNPFRLRAPHPSKVLLDPTSKSPKEAIIHREFYAHELETMTQKRGGRVYEAGNNPYEVINCVEYWSVDYHCLLVEGEKYFGEENVWGFVPYSHAFSGFGGETTADPFNPRQLAVGMLDYIREALRVQSQAQSGRHEALVEAAYMPWGTNKNAAEIAEHLRRGDLVPGIRPGDLFKVQGTDLPSWLFKAEDMIDSDLEQATFSKQLSGIREEGVSTVGQQAILTTAAGRKFVMPQRQIEHMATIATSRILHCIDQVIDEPLTCRGYTIRPSDIDHDYSVLVKFQVVDPVLQLQRRQQGMAEVQAGLKSVQTFWEADAELEDATGEERRIRLERVKQGQMVQQALDMIAAKELGLDDLLDEQEEQQGQDSGSPAILGPDGMPMDQTMGSGTLRQPLTDDIAKPAQLPMGGGLLGP